MQKSALDANLDITAQQQLVAPESITVEIKDTDAARDSHSTDLFGKVLAEFDQVGDVCNDGSMLKHEDKSDVSPPLILWLTFGYFYS